MNPKITAAAGLLLTVGLLAACAAVTPSEAPSAVLPTACPTVETGRVLAAPGRSSSDESARIAEDMATSTGHPTPTPVPYPTAPSPGTRASEAALIFLPPLPSAAEIMEWRPPCLPVPHSIHPDDHYWLRRPIPSGNVDWGLDRYPYGGNGFGLWHTHHGMDMPNDPGTPVLAAGDGTVVWVTENWYPVYVMIEQPQPAAEMESEQDNIALGPEAEIQADGVQTSQAAGAEASQAQATLRQMVEPYGNMLIIQHDWGWQGKPVYTLYGHLLEVFVEVGDHVRAGDLVAGVGNTGASSGPHLHFEVRWGVNDYSHTINPALWLAPYEGWGTLAGRITTADGAFVYNASLTITPAHSNAWTEGETRIVTSYANDEVNPDPIWQENFVIPDLPAGDYVLTARTGCEVLQASVTIRPGTTSFVKLHTD